MSYFLTKETDVFDIFDQSCRCYWMVLKRVFPLMLFFALIEVLLGYGNRFLNHLVVYRVFLLVEALVFLYFLSVMVYQVQSILEGRAVTLRNACQIVLRHYLPIATTFIVFLILIIGYYLFFSHVIVAMMHDPKVVHGMVSLFFLFSSVLLMVFIVFFLFMFPLMILDHLSPLQAMKRSYQLSRSRPVQIFTLYAGMALLAYILSPRTHHAHFFMHYHAWLLFCAAVYCILLPFLVNYMLFMLNDLKIRV